MQRTHHPDRGGDVEAFNRVQDAYNTIVAAFDAEENRDIFAEIFRDIARRSKF